MTYTYDEVGNRLTKVASGAATTYSYDAADQWREKLSRPEDEEAVSGVRASSHTGRPLGSDAFLSKVESLMGRRIRPLRIGRPKKVVEEEENR
ncbi:MAG: RHS repeat protein [Armatimonadetes bacterium]|nr:RHS repeat protein [Armatimonadota bacterium]